MNSRQHITFIVNPISGTHNKHIILQLVDELIDKERYSYIVRGTEYAGHASLLAEEAVRQHADIVVAIGGDGTHHAGGRSMGHTHPAM